MLLPSPGTSGVCRVLGVHPGSGGRAGGAPSLQGHPFWDTRGCVGDGAATPALSLVRGVRHLPKTTLSVNHFCFSSPKTPWRNFPVLGWLQWSCRPCLSQPGIPRESPALLSPSPLSSPHPPQSIHPSTARAAALTPGDLGSEIPWVDSASVSVIFLSCVRLWE